VSEPHGRRIASALGILGGVGGIAVSVWFLLASSRGGGEPVVDFSEGELKALSVVALVLFCVVLAAGVSAGRFPRASGLTLIVAAGLSLIVAIYGIVVWFFGGLLLVPFGLLAMIGGVVAVASSGGGDRHP